MNNDNDYEHEPEPDHEHEFFIRASSFELRHFVTCVTSHSPASLRSAPCSNLLIEKFNNLQTRLWARCSPKKKQQPLEVTRKSPKFEQAAVKFVRCVTERT